MEVEKPKIEVTNPSHFTWLKRTLFCCNDAWFREVISIFLK